MCSNQHPDTPTAASRLVSAVQIGGGNGKKGNIVTSNKAIMGFLQQEKDECKLVVFQTFTFREFRCVMCGRIRKGSAWSAKNLMRAWKRRH